MPETRTIEQVKIYYLVLNPMTDRAEACMIAAFSDDKERLMQWYNSLKVEGYNDGRYGKIFKKDSPLEWFNPMDNEDGTLGFFGHGLQSEWVDVEEVLEIQCRYFKVE